MKRSEVNVEAVTTFGGPLCQCGYDELSTHGHLGIVDVIVAVAVASYCGSCSCSYSCCCLH